MPQALPENAHKNAVAVTPKGVATRAFILQTAAEAFSEDGYAETTLAELIARTGLTKGAFYFYFPSKEQLALAVLEEKQDQWLEAVRTRVLAQPTAIAQLRALGPAILQLHRDDHSTFSISRLARDLRRSPGTGEEIRARMQSWIDLVADILDRAKEDGELPPELDSGSLAGILIAATDGLKDLSDLIDPPGRSRRAYERRMSDLIALIEGTIDGWKSTSG
jgi:AcrR family transcriptional regulator